MIARARLLAVLVILGAGAVGVISSTQTWLVVTLESAAQHALPVPGSAAVPLLAPLSLAVLAVGGALTVVGLVLRWVFGGLAVAIGATLAVLCAQVAFTRPIAAVASTVTAATGITGEAAVTDLVRTIDATAWPVVTLMVSAALAAAGVFTVATARTWRGSGRRYRTSSATATSSAATGAAASRPHDAIDSWDDLSRGDDPTER